MVASDPTGQQSPRRARCRIASLTSRMTNKHTVAKTADLLRPYADKRKPASERPPTGSPNARNQRLSNASNAKLQ